MSEIYLFLVFPVPIEWFVSIGSLTRTKHDDRIRSWKLEVDWLFCSPPKSLATFLRHRQILLLSLSAAITVQAKQGGCVTDRGVLLRAANAAPWSCVFGSNNLKTKPHSPSHWTYQTAVRINKMEKVDDRKIAVLRRAHVTTSWRDSNASREWPNEK